MDGSSFKMLELTLSFKLDWSSYIIPIVKTASQKIGASIRSIKFIFLDVALYLCESIMQPCIEYCCHVWAGCPSCYLELLDKLQKQIYRNLGPSLAACFELVPHHQDVASLSFSVGITLVDDHLNWLN